MSALDTFFRMPTVYACDGHIFLLCCAIKTTRGTFSSEDLLTLNLRTHFQYDIVRVSCVPATTGLLYVIDYNLGYMICSSF